VNANSESSGTGIGKGRWIAAGFIGAFAASVLTIIYTGLKVEGTNSAEFDAGFHSITMVPGEVRTIHFAFDSSVDTATAKLELTLPAMLERVDRPGERNPSETVALHFGTNEFDVEVRALAAGSDYLIARAVADEPVGLDRIFVVVGAD